MQLQKLAPTLVLLACCGPGLLQAGHDLARSDIVLPFFVQTGPPSHGYDSAVEVINPNALATIVRFRFFDLTGRAAVPMTTSAIGVGTVGSAQDLEIGSYGWGRISFTFPRDQFVGWVRVTATQPIVVQQEIARYGIPAFSPAGTPPPLVTLQTRILKSPPFASRQHLVAVQFDTGGRGCCVAGPAINTGIAIAFPAAENDTAATLKLILRAPSGAKIYETEVAVAPNGLQAHFFTDWFPQLFIVPIQGFGLTGTLELLSSHDVYVTAIRVSSFRSEEKWEEPGYGRVGAVALGHEYDSAQTEMVFPFYVKKLDLCGAGFNSAFEIINPNPLPAEVTFHPFDSGGTAIGQQPIDRPSLSLSPPRLTVSGGAIETVTLPSPPDQFTFPDLVGWVRIKSTRPVIVHAKLFRSSTPGPPSPNPCFNRPVIISQILKPASLASRRELVKVLRFSGFFFAPTSWSDTGVSVVFPSATGAVSAKVRLVLRDHMGKQVAETAIRISPNGQAVGFFLDWFPNFVVPPSPTEKAGPTLLGTLEFVSDRDIHVSAVQVTSSSLGEKWEEPASGTVPLGVFGRSVFLKGGVE